MIRAVIFDLDGVISDTEPLHVRVEHAVLGARGIEVPPGGLAGTQGLRDPDFFARVFHERGVAGDVAAATAAKRRAMLACPPDEITEITGARALIEDLHAHGVRLAVASSSPPAFIAHVLGALKLDRFFDVVASGDDVARGKPAPDVFLLAAERLGVAPRDCAVIEDSANGMAAARAAGMRCIGLVPGAGGRYEADEVVTSLATLTADRLAGL